MNIHLVSFLLGIFIGISIVLFKKMVEYKQMYLKENRTVWEMSDRIRQLQIIKDNLVDFILRENKNE